MQKKLKARILSLALSALMVISMMQTTVFATEGGDIAPSASSVGEIQSFNKLEDRFSPSTGKDAPNHIYGLTVEQDTPEEDLNLPDELTAMVARTTTVTTSSDATEDKETIPVTWNSDKEYKSNEKGQFIYTAEISEDYILADGVELPQIYVSVGDRLAREGTTHGGGVEGMSAQSRAASATISDVTVVGWTNWDIIDVVKFRVDLVGDTFSMAVGNRFDSMFNKPDGIDVNQSAGSGGQQGDNFVIFSISGIPTATKSEPIKMTIPGDVLESGNEIVVTVNPNAKWDIRPQPTATISDGTVSGTVGENITAKEFTLTIENATLNNTTLQEKRIFMMKDNSSLNGLTLTVTEATPGSNTLKFQITGKPAKAATDAIKIKISGGIVNSARSITVAENANAKLDIKGPAGPDYVFVYFNSKTGPVSGTVGTAIDEAEFYIRLESSPESVFSKTITAEDIKGIFTNLPDGLDVTTIVEGGTPDNRYVIFKIAGTPTSAASGPITLDFPSELLSYNTTDIRYYPPNNNNTWNIVGTASNNVAKIGDTEYETLQKAFDVVTDGQTITLLADIDLGMTGATLNKDSASVKLDLNGKKITYSNYESAITLSAGSLEIADSASGGAVSATGQAGKAISNNGTGSVTITDGTVSAAGNNGKAINNDSTGTVTVTGGTVSAAGEFSYAIYNSVTGTVTISGGTVSNATARGGIAIHNKRTGTVTISGGTVSATTEYAINNNSTGTVTISGGTVSATTGRAIYNNSTGLITISQAAGKTTLVTSTNATATQGTIYLNKVPTTDPKTVLNVQGGTVSNTAQPEGYSVYFKDTAVTAANLTDYYTKAGSATVGKVYPEAAASNNVAKIGGTEYETLQKAFTAVTDGQTIQILKNIDLGATGVTLDKTGASVTLDLNGKAITYSGAVFAIDLTAGSLEITDGGTSGKISATADYGTAIINQGTGTVTVSGGTVSGEGKSCKAIDNDSTGKVTVSGGTVSLTKTGGQAIRNASAGTVTVSGGTVSTITGMAIYNFSTGTVDVSDGMVSATTTGMAIYNASTGTVNVSGGTVRTTTSYAIFNLSTGLITISQAQDKTTLVTSEQSDSTHGTIHLFAVPTTAPKTVLNVLGGTVSNTAGDGKYSVYFEDTAVTAANLTNYYTEASGATVGRVYPEPPTITINTQPSASKTVAYGEITGSLTVAGTASNGNAVSYQWYKNATNSAAGGTAVSGATSGTFTIPTDLDAGTHYYYCVLKADGCADKTSSVATVTVSKATHAAVTKEVGVKINEETAPTGTLTAADFFTTVPKDAKITTISGSASNVLSAAPTVSNGTLSWKAKDNLTTKDLTDSFTVTITSKNYNNISATLNFKSIDKKPATITADVAGKTYNGEAVTQPTPTAVEEGTTTPVTLTYTYKWQEKDSTGNYIDISGNTAPKDAGDYKLIVEGKSDTHTGKKEITFTISKATITITADNKSAYVGDAKPALTYTATGKASGDTFVTEPTLAYESEPDMSKAGNVKITASGAAVPNEDNYESAITYVDGTLTIAKLPEPTPEKPTITAGGGSNHQISSGKDITFTCSGALEDLEGIYVDGKLVDPSNYTLKSGSTILTLKASYLDTLSVGKHTLKFQYKDNVSAETNFTITAKAGETPTTKPGSPQTGDSSNLMVLFTLLLASGGTLTALLARRRKTGRHYSK